MLNMSKSEVFYLSLNIAERDIVQWDSYRIAFLVSSVCQRFAIGTPLLMRHRRQKLPLATSC